MLSTVIVAAAAASSDPGIWDILVKAFGIPAFALLVLAMIRGWIVTGQEYQRVVTERNQEREERIKAQEALTEKTLPTLLETQHVLERVTRFFDSSPGRQQ